MNNRCMRQNEYCPAPPDMNMPADMSIAVDMSIVADLTEPLPPRLIAPMSTSAVTSRRPLLRWVLPSGGSSVGVDLCSDRSCVHSIQTAVAVDASGTSGAPMADLPQGVVYWRVNAVVAGTNMTSQTWQLWVGRRSATEANTTDGIILDVNGDGHPDYAAGALYAADASHESVAGRAYLWLGSAKGPDPTSTPTRFEGRDGSGALFGAGLARAGDVNGDGYGDLLIDAPYAMVGGNQVGRDYLFLGSADGIDPVHAITIAPPNGEAGPGLRAQGAGDINGDGYGDVILGAALYSSETEHRCGRAYVLYGSASGLDLAHPTTFASVDGINSTMVGNAAGDLNGDGYADIALTAPGAFDKTGVANTGRVRVYLGGPDGLTGMPTILEPGMAGIGFGSAVGGADLNGDGYSDLFVGAASDSVARIYVFFGSHDGVSAANSIHFDLPVGVFRLGVVAANAGDVDGDGFDDLIVGAAAAPDLAGNPEAGQVWIFFGPKLVDRAPNTIFNPNSNLAQFGESVGLGPSDFDGNGYADLVIGSWQNGPNHDNQHWSPGRVDIYLSGKDGIDIAHPLVFDGLDGEQGKFGDALAWRHRPGRRGDTATNFVLASGREGSGDRSAGRRRAAPYL
jgi:hypothetical protein